MRTELFDFDLPEDRIALHPVSPRDAARMLCVEPGTAPVLGDRGVRDLVDILQPGDCIVVNDTRVIASALEGRRQARDGASSVGASDDGTVSVHVNLHKRVDARRWLAFARPGKRLKEGDTVSFGGAETVAFSAVVEAKHDGGEIALRFDTAGAELDAAIAAAGSMPLPPYIAAKRSTGTDDARDYQTVYAVREGAVAAPTAGLHFTPELFDALEARGVSRQTVTLHVGAGTFLPVKVDDTREHVMHAEWGEVTIETANALNETRKAGGRIVAVGTTSLRLLESAVDKAGRYAEFSNDTAIFITPGYRFRAVDILMTNFHLPKSTLFMLVSAFSGLDTMKSAYAHAIEAGYRFYSYGDACLLFRDDSDASSV